MLQTYLVELLFGSCTVQEDLKKSDFLSLIQQGKFSQATAILNQYSHPNDRLEFLELLYSNSKSLTQVTKDTPCFLINAYIALRNISIASNLSSLKVRVINSDNPFIHLLFSARLPIPFASKAKLLKTFDNLIVDLLHGKAGNFYIDFACTECNKQDFEIIKGVTEKILRNENKSFCLLFNTLGVSQHNETFISLTQANKILRLQPLQPTKIGSWVGRIDSKLVLSITATLTQEKFLEYIA